MKHKRIIKPGVSWARSAGGFIPHYRFRGMHAMGPERPFPQFLLGERMTVARYFLCLTCETLFGVSPLTFDVGENGQDYTNFRPNSEWEKLPYMVENPDYPDKSKFEWVMNDGNPDVLGMFDFGDQFKKAAKAAEDARSESVEQEAEET